MEGKTSILSIVLTEAAKAGTLLQKDTGMNAFDDNYLRPSDIARRLALHRSQIYKLIKDGTLPHIRIGRAVRVPVGAFEAYLRSLHGRPHAPDATGRVAASAPGEVASRLAAFQAATGGDPFAYLDAWKSGEIADTAENAENAMDALALRAVLQRESAAA
jgi:excisionase family DNA binding protein